MLLRGDRDYAEESQPGRVTVPWVQAEKSAGFDQDANGICV